MSVLLAPQLARMTPCAAAAMTADSVTRCSLSAVERSPVSDAQIFVTSSETGLRGVSQHGALGLPSGALPNTSSYV